MTFSYNELINRNSIYIDQMTQKKISQKTLLLFGCGLNSVLAVQAARIGFCRFILIDGDKVELSNLNRQEFFLNQVGKYKVDALKENILNINPEAKVQVYKKMVNSIDEVSTILAKADYIINTVDINDLYYDIVDYCINYKSKYVFSPFNIGFGALVLVFKDGFGLNNVIKRVDIKNEADFYYRLMRMVGFFKIPNYLRRLAKKIISHISLGGSTPQLSIGANIASSIIVTLIIKIIKEEKVPLAPKYTYIDLL